MDKKIEKHYMPWTEEDDAYLRENYKTMSDKEMQVVLKRKITNIGKRRRELGLLKEQVFSPHVLEKRQKQTRWEAEELDYLEKNYTTQPMSEIIRVLRRDEQSIKVKATQMGLKSFIKVRKDWTPEEERYMQDMYGKKSVEELAKMFGRTFYSVRAKATELGLTACRGTIWEEWEDEIIVNNHNMTSEELRVLLPHRTLSAICGRRAKIGIFKHIRSYKQEKYVTRTKTNYRQLMARHLGRKILPTEHVHHIDFNQDNNEINNLVLLSSSEHMKAHRSIDDIARLLIEKNIIQYNREENKYFLSTTQ